MKWFVLLSTFFVILGGVSAMGPDTMATDTIPGLKLKTFSNATYPDGHSIGNLAMIYDPLITNKYILLWDEKENYTLNGREVLVGEIMISTSSDFVNWSGNRRDIVISKEDGANSSSPSGTYDPSSGKIFVVWSEVNRTSGFKEIYLGTSTDGITWNSTVKNTVISNIYDGKVSNCTHPHIAVTSDGYQHAVWLGFNSTTGTWEVYYGSGYGDGTWSSERKDNSVSVEDSSSAQSVDIVADNSASTPRVWIFWTEYVVSDDAYAVFAANSTAPYGKWNTTIVSSTYGMNAYNVSAIIYNGNLFLFWEQEVNEQGKKVKEIAAKNFLGGKWANTFGGNLTISYPDGHNATHPRGGINQNGIFVMWDEYDEISGYRQVMFGNSTGGNWTSENSDLRLTAESTNNIMPSLYLGENQDIYIAWMHWIEDNNKQRGVWEGCTLRAAPQDIIPEFAYIGITEAIIAVLIYASWKRERSRSP